MPETVVREDTSTVVHPEFWNGWTRVDKADHPMVGVLYDGAPDLGWSADERLCLYRNSLENCYILVRLEWDGEYRMVIRSPAGEILSPDSINRLIRKLISVDGRRGWDPATTLDMNESRRKAQDDAWGEYVHHEVSDRLVWWATHAHLAGIDVAPKIRR